MFGKHPNPFAVAVFLTAAAFACNRSELQLSPELQMFELMRPVAATKSDHSLLFASKFEIYNDIYKSGNTSDNLPVVMVSRAQAQNWALQRGCRLPSKQEWLRLRGSDFVIETSVGLSSANNLESQAHRVFPVGVFEGARSEWGIYDLEGNVWEWLADDVVDAKAAISGTQQHAQVIGGSWANTGYNYYAVKVLEAEESADDIGFRVVADGDDWLVSQVLILWGDSPNKPFMRKVIGDWNLRARAQIVQAYGDKLPPDMVEVLGVFFE